MRDTSVRNEGGYHPSLHKDMTEASARRGGRVASGLLGLGLLVGGANMFVVENYTELKRWAAAQADSGIAYNGGSCPPTSVNAQPADKAKKRGEDNEKHEASTSSGMWENKMLHISPRKSLEVYRNSYRYLQYEGTLERNDTLIQVYSNTEHGIQVNGAELNSMFEDVLHASRGTKHTGISTKMECIYDNYMNGELPQGDRLAISVWSSRGACYGNLHIMEDVSSECQTTGFTVAALPFRFGGRGLLGHSSMGITAPYTDIVEAEAHLTKVLVHEILHYYLAMIGDPIRPDRDESFVDTVMSHLRATAPELFVRRPFRYSDDDVLAS